MAEAALYDNLKRVTLNKLESNDLLLQQCLQFVFCDTINSRRIQDRIKTLKDLLNILEQRDELSASHVTPLKKLAEMVNDCELYGIIDEFEKRRESKKQSACECGEMKYFNEKDILPPQQNNIQVVSEIYHHPPPSQPPSEHENNLLAVFQFLMENLGRSWKELARFLKIPEGEIDVIIHDNRYLKDQIFEMLNLWKKENGEDATIPILCIALGNSRRKDLADKILRKYTTK